MVNQAVSRYMAEIGRTGGRKSRRQLDRDQAQKMVRIREARRAYREFHDRCFWSSPPDFQVMEQDLPWVIEQLRRHGGRSGWERAERLCR
jgi:hypothetical protein